MLRQRVLTALVLGPLAIWGILALPTKVFALVVALIMVLSAWEWSRLAHLHATSVRAAYAGVLPAVLLALYSPMQQSLPALFALLSAALVWWGAALILVVNYPAASSLWRTTVWAPSLAGYAVLVPAWVALAALHAKAGPPFVLLLMMLVWGADVGAFFAGRQWGRRKLAPRVSPGKTWEGLMGALAVTGMLAVAGLYALDVPPQWRAVFLLVCVLTVLLSVVGDLMESMFKRMADVKDSSRLLPGHGGVLDRVDSVTAAAPVFAGGLLLIGVGV